MNIIDNVNRIKDLIKSAEKACHRPENSILLLAVTKSQPVDLLREAYSLGLNHFGENYFQEAQAKMELLMDLPICWHFIGPIQSNKTKGIATQFQWVHSIDRLKIAELLSQHRPSTATPLNICLQVNLVAEETKSGMTPDEALVMAAPISKLPHLKLRGLMTIPPPQNTLETQYDIFQQLNQLLQAINQHHGLDMDTLSMGMSDDLIPAIKAGATIVRVGRALFGERKR